MGCWSHPYPPSHLTVFSSTATGSGPAPGVGRTRAARPAGTVSLGSSSLNAGLAEAWGSSGCMGRETAGPTRTGPLSWDRGLKACFKFQQLEKAALKADDLLGWHSPTGGSQPLGGNPWVDTPKQQQQQQQQQQHPATRCK